MGRVSGTRIGFTPDAAWPIFFRFDSHSATSASWNLTNFQQIRDAPKGDVFRAMKGILSLLTNCFT